MAVDLGSVPAWTPPSSSAPTPGGEGSAPPQAPPPQRQSAFWPPKPPAPVDKQAQAPTQRYPPPTQQPPPQEVKHTPHVVFLVDTSVSMNQRCIYGTTLLDVAKRCVTHFIAEARSNPMFNCMYSLMSFEDDLASALKYTPKEAASVLEAQLASLEATDTSTLSVATRNVFDYLNMTRFQSNVDTFAQGRRPWVAEHTMIVLLTDGGSIIQPPGPPTAPTPPLPVDTFTMPPFVSSLPGAELQAEAFRWDQRVFAITLCIPGIDPNIRLPPVIDGDQPLAPIIHPIGREALGYDHAIAPFCRSTGGLSLTVRDVFPGGPGLCEHQRRKHDCVECGRLKGVMDVVVKNIPQAGVIVSFDRLKDEPLAEGIGPRLEGQAAANIMLKEQRHPGIWPIPEPYWVDPTLDRPQPRTREACTIRFSCRAVKWQVEDGFFDKYQLTHCNLVKVILDQKNPDEVYQVFMPGSHKSGVRGHPFGFLKPSSSNDGLFLFVMPYNYPVLLELLNRLKQMGGNPNAKWRQDFEGYIADVPYYYIPALRERLRRFNVDRCIPQHLDGNMPPHVRDHLGRITKAAQTEIDRFTAAHAKRQAQLRQLRSVPIPTAITPQHQQDALLKGTKRTHAEMVALGMELEKNAAAAGTSDSGPETRINPFDTPRDRLLDTYYMLAGQFYSVVDGFPALEDEDTEHSVLCSEMGANSPSYHRAMARELASQFRPARDDESQQHPKGIPFGNPYLDDKAVDWARAGQPRHPARRAAATPPPGLPRPGGPPQQGATTPPAALRNQARPPPGLAPSPGAGIGRHPPPPGTVPGGAGGAPGQVQRGPPRPAGGVPPRGKPTWPHGGPGNTGSRPPGPNVVPGQQRNPGPQQALNRPPMRPQQQGMRMPNPAGMPGGPTPPPQQRPSGPPVSNASSNQELKMKIVTEMRRPGNAKTVQTIVMYLNHIQGDQNTKKDFVRDIINEARKLKKQNLIQLLDDQLNSL